MARRLAPDRSALEAEILAEIKPSHIRARDDLVRLAFHENLAGMDDATRRIIEALVNRPNIAAKAPAIPGLLGYQATAQ